METTGHMTKFFILNQPTDPMCIPILPKQRKFNRYA